MSAPAQDAHIRHVARIILVNRSGETFLLRGKDPGAPERPPFWFTVGGKIDPGETPQQAAVRELAEEVGITASAADLSAEIGTEDSLYQFQGTSYRQSGVFFALLRDEVTLDGRGWTAIEAQTIDQGRWWRLAELRTTRETIYPAHLADLLEKAQATLFNKG